MARGSVNFIELHIEKALLGLAGVLLLTMVWLYLIGSPNTIEYKKGERVAAAQLPEAIRRDAEALQMAVRRAKPKRFELHDYSKELEERHAAGIFASTPEAPPLPREVRLAANFGKPLPTLAEEEENSGDIVLVTPLKPSQPVLRTGRCLAVRRSPKIGAALDAEPDDEDEELAESLEPVEFPWVSIAAYFPRKAQEAAMNDARYATHRSRAYLVGSEVQRQEMLASGEFATWQGVTDSKAMPQIELADPEFDEENDEIVNVEKIRDTYKLVKAMQAALAQPPFYEVEAGDFWEMPALPGFEEAEEEEAAEVRPVARKEPRRSRVPTQRRHPKVRAPTGVIGISAGGGGGSGSSRRSGEAQEKKRARKQIRDDLREANDALRRKDHARAMDLARRVINQQYATGGDTKRAQGILDRAEKLKKRQARRPARPSDRFTGGPVMFGPGGSLSKSGGGAAPAGRGGTAAMITRPDDDGQVVVWFHDDAVEAGKTYRYRMRVKLWNRYVGKMGALKDPEQAKRSVIVGEWSLPSGSITVAPSTHFFVASPAMSGDEARVEVWKWRKGDWLKQSFNVGIGDVIGGVRKVATGEIGENGKDVKEDVDFTTGAIVLDLRFKEPIMMRTSAGKGGQFNLRPSQSLVLVYLDPADGQVKQRVQAFDKYDPIYRRLKDEYDW